MVRPNPGSFEAKAQGCTCPTMDNNRGKWPPFPPGTAWGGTEGGWFIVEGCPVHDTGAEG